MITSTSCDASGYGEGRDSLGSVTVPITALVTDALGHTSELSSCVVFGLGNDMFSDGFESGAPYAWSRLSP